MTSNIERNRQLATSFFKGLSAGELPDALFTEDMQAWTVSSAEWKPKATYQGGARLLALAFPEGLDYTILSLTAEEDRVAAEVRSEGVLTTGEDFRNEYLFQLKFVDGLISRVSEFFDPKPVQEKLVPVLQEIMAKQKG